MLCSRSTLSSLDFLRFTKAYLIASETGCVFMCCLPIINGMCLMLTRFNWFPDPLTKNFRRSEDFLGKFNFLFNRQDCDAKETYERGVSIFRKYSCSSACKGGVSLSFDSYKTTANFGDWKKHDLYFASRVKCIFRQSKRMFCSGGRRTKTHEQDLIARLEPF